MRFLMVSTASREIPPPDVAAGMGQATLAWIDAYAGKIEQAWAFAGGLGAGGIVNVESLEELDEILSSWPAQPWADYHLYPLIDVRESMERYVKAQEALAAAPSSSAQSS